MREQHAMREQQHPMREQQHLNKISLNTDTTVPKDTTVLKDTGKLYTSFFANISNIPRSMRVFSVVRKPQDLPNITDFAPSTTLLNQYKSKKITYPEFKQRYVAELGTNPKASIMFDSITTLLNQGTDVVLVCYEKKPDYCHRKILGEIFSLNGIEYCGEI